MHSTQKGKWLDVFTSFPALACGTSPRPLTSELLYWSKVNKASGILCCPWIQKQCGCLCQSEAASLMIFFTWREGDREPKMRLAPVLYQEVRGWDHLFLLCCGSISVIDYVEVMSSSSGLFICPGYLRAGVIRARCSGRSAVAPGVLRSVFTHFSMKDSCKNRPVRLWLMVLL